MMKVKSFYFNFTNCSLIITRQINQNTLNDTTITRQINHNTLNDTPSKTIANDLP